MRRGDGTEAETGAAGEIWVRGEQVAGEYAEGGSTLDDDGWFCTRDSGHTDEAGYLWVHGRNDDIIIRGGENMSPGEVEDVLLTHPAVVDAAAFGVPSREWGEELAVCVITRSPAPAADDSASWYGPGCVRAGYRPVWSSSTSCPTTTRANCCAGN